MLLFIQGCRLTCRAHSYNGIGTLLNVPVHQRTQAILINAAVFPHWGNERYHTALKHVKKLQITGSIAHSKTPDWTLTRRSANSTELGSANRAQPIVIHRYLICYSEVKLIQEFVIKW
jgi:hypothetical protein